MMTLLIRALRQPSTAYDLSLNDWDILIRQARHANLLGRLCTVLNNARDPDKIPEKPLNHLVSGAAMASRQHLSIRREAFILREALAQHGIPLILLKGAAYVMADLPAKAGRVFADIDILVPHSALGATESALMLNGWITTTQDEYDQRYYRTWMHELPAMQHMYRGTSLDVHHSILPPTARLKPAPELLINASREIPDAQGIRVLCPTDMVLHSAAHLFHEGESDNLLRDLSDLDLLLQHFAEAPAFWDQLTQRAVDLDLVAPFKLALRYAAELFDTPVPQPLRATTSGVRQRALDMIYRRLLKPQHSSATDALTPLARKLLFLRAHWLRMPPHLLAYHLGHKMLFPPKPVSRPEERIENNG